MRGRAMSPVIREHCRPGGWRGRQHPHTPSDIWPRDCLVQWGPAIAAGPAFFEAFPSSGENGGFFRGEGETIAAAEAAALEKFKRAQACDAHRWARGSYVNGAGICRRCGAFRSGAFRPVVKLGEWRRPVSRYVAEMIKENPRACLRKSVLRFRHFGTMEARMRAS